jgi:hypothetical protein
MMYLREFMEKTPTRYLRGRIGFAAEPLMEPEVGAKTGAAHGERSAEKALTAVIQQAYNSVVYLQIGDF